MEPEIEVTYDHSPEAALRWRAGLAIIIALINERDAGAMHDGPRVLQPAA